MGDHLNFNNLLWHNIHNEIPIALNLCTPSIETPRTTKDTSSISEIKHYTDQKYDERTLNNFENDLLLDTKSHLPSREENNKNEFLEKFITSLKKVNCVTQK